MISYSAGVLKAIHANEDVAAARAKALQVIEKLRAMRLTKAAEVTEAAFEETLTYYAFPEEHCGASGRTIHWSASCVRSDGTLVWLARFPMASPRHIAGTAWSHKRYLNMELLKDQQMRGAITA